MTMLYEGAALALLVVWLFLRDWRATWISRWRCRCR
jgi:multidrug efflux pump subunit AcrB